MLPFVHADGMGCFLHVGCHHLTQDTDGVGAADPLSQERDGSLGKDSVWDPQPHLLCQHIAAWRVPRSTHWVLGIQCT